MDANPSITMKLKSIFLTTTLAAVVLLTPQALRAQASPSATPGAPPKFGPEDHQRHGGRPHDGGRPGMRNPEERLAHLKEVLGLTPEQESKIREIFKAEGEKMRAEHEANKGTRPEPGAGREKMRAEREKVQAAIKAVLTPEQVTKWEAMKKERHDHGQPQPGADIPKS